MSAHIVWCPKYRRKILTGDIAKRFMELVKEKAPEIGISIISFEVMPDHTHLFVEYDPTLCVAEIVARIKGFTSRVLRKEFPSIRSRLPTLWSRSYYAGSVGQVSAAAVQKYIENQKGK